MAYPIKRVIYGKEYPRDNRFKEIFDLYGIEYYEASAEMKKNIGRSLENLLTYGYYIPVVLSVENIDYGTQQVNLRYSNFRVVKKSDHEVHWQEGDSQKIIAVMEEKEGTLNFKRFWK